MSSRISKDKEKQRKLWNKAGKKRKRTSVSDLKKAPKPVDNGMVFDLASLVGMAQEQDTQSIAATIQQKTTNNNTNESSMDMEMDMDVDTTTTIQNSSQKSEKKKKRRKKDKKEKKDKKDTKEKKASSTSTTTSTSSDNTSSNTTINITTNKATHSTATSTTTATPEETSAASTAPTANDPTSVGFGSRSNPTQLRFRDILQNATTSMRANVVRKSLEPVPSKSSNHLFAADDIVTSTSISSSSSSSSSSTTAASLKSKSTKVVKTTNTSTWESLGLDTRLCRHVRGYTYDGKSKGLQLAIPTRVQRMAIPIILNGDDVVVRSETGSGKTITYLLPMVTVLASMTAPRIQRSDGTLAIILAPTRELTAQVSDWTLKVLKPYPWLVTGSITGGERPKSEKARLRKGLTILTCTPGRLLYHLQSTKSFSTERLQWLVLDEADRLMDLGFHKQLTEILELLSERHRKPSTKNGFPWQTMLISATLSDSVKALVGKALRAPKYIDASSAANKKRLKGKEDLTEDGMSESSESTAHQIPQQLSQHVALVDSPHRLVALIGFLRQQIVASRALSRAAASSTSGNAAPTGCRIVVFLATCASVDFHYALFDKLANSGGATSGVAAGLTDVASLAAILRNSLYKLHGEVNQSERSKTFKDFCTSGNGVLLCTDVAARGLDMPNINWIVQYDPPTELTEYVHRIGRTARRGRAGSAILMLRPCEAGYVKLLKNRMGVDMVQLRRTALVDGLCEEHHGRKGSSRRIEVATRLQTQLQTLVERIVDSDSQLQQIAGEAFHKSVRAYACHSKESKPMFNIRRLHLGHVAKSFGLKNPPTKIKKTLKKKDKKKGPGEPDLNEPSINIQSTGLNDSKNVNKNNPKKKTSYKLNKFAESEFGS